MSQCVVCQEAPSKYKCPKCSIRYCSIGCFKSPRHRNEHGECLDIETGAVLPQAVAPSKQEAAASAAAASRPVQPLSAEAGTTDQEPNLELLRNHAELKEMIQSDPILENYIKAIHEAQDPYSYLDQLKENERFVKFSNLIMQIIQQK
ncbi:Zinc finger HIT domain-containing protein 3 [Kappamyces sp. JEL0829]|nr:Zinc finger HIT domain-containing protein 3 [Kappamyces sp. JEL0829]